jgi:hypothetical protein
VIRRLGEWVIGENVNGDDAAEEHGFSRASSLEVFLGGFSRRREEG